MRISIGDAAHGIFHMYGWVGWWRAENEMHTIQQQMMKIHLFFVRSKNFSTDNKQTIV